MQGVFRFLSDIFSNYLSTPSELFCLIDTHYVQALCCGNKFEAVSFPQKIAWKTLFQFPQASGPYLGIGMSLY